MNLKKICKFRSESLMQTTKIEFEANATRIAGAVFAPDHGVPDCLMVLIHGDKPCNQDM